jgi:uncharacterized linocin/CFP29 family protein
MDHLLRSAAPISEAGWKLLDDEARERLAPALAARKLVDFSGPHGWEHSATNLGRTSPLADAPGEGVSGLQRRVLALVESRADFALSRAELRDADRGADDADLAPLAEAARRIAAAENAAVFHGWGAAIRGIGELTAHRHIALGGPTPTRPRWPAPSRRCSAAESQARTALRSEESSTARRSSPSRAATPSQVTCARSSAGRSCGLPA